MPPPPCAAPKSLSSIPDPAAPALPTVNFSFVHWCCDLPCSQSVERRMACAPTLSWESCKPPLRMPPPCRCSSLRCFHAPAKSARPPCCHGARLPLPWCLPACPPCCQTLLSRAASALPFAAVQAPPLLIVTLASQCSAVNCRSHGAGRTGMGGGGEQGWCQCFSASTSTVPSQAQAPSTHT